MIFDGRYALHPAYHQQVTTIPRIIFPECQGNLRVMGIRTENIEIIFSFRTITLAQCVLVARGVKAQNAFRTQN